jgi:hypothetical protein
MRREAELHTTRRWRRGLSVCVVALLAPGCRPQGPGGLVGAIHFRGGPSGALITQRQGGQVRLVRAHKVFATALVRPGGGFHFGAPPGTYELEARSGDAICRSKAVTVHAAATAQMDMICDVR